MEPRKLPLRASGLKMFFHLRQAFLARFQCNIVGGGDVEKLAHWVLPEQSNKIPLLPYVAIRLSGEDVDFPCYEILLSMRKPSVSDSQSRILTVKHQGFSRQWYLLHNFYWQPRGSADEPRKTGGKYSDKAILSKKKARTLVITKIFCILTFEPLENLAALFRIRDLRPFECSNNPVWLSHGVLSVSGFEGWSSLRKKMYRSLWESCLARFPWHHLKPCLSSPFSPPYCHPLNHHYFIPVDEWIARLIT